MALLAEQVAQDEGEALRQEAATRLRPLLDVVTRRAAIARRIVISRTATRRTALREASTKSIDSLRCGLGWARRPRNEPDAEYRGASRPGARAAFHLGW